MKTYVNQTEGKSLRMGEFCQIEIAINLFKNRFVKSTVIGFLLALTCYGNTFGCDEGIMLPSDSLQAFITWTENGTGPDRTGILSLVSDQLVENGYSITLHLQLDPNEVGDANLTFNSEDSWMNNGMGLEEVLEWNPQSGQLSLIVSRSFCTPASGQGEITKILFSGLPPEGNPGASAYIDGGGVMVENLDVLTPQFTWNLLEDQLEVQGEVFSGMVQSLDGGPPASLNPTSDGLCIDLRTYPTGLYLLYLRTPQGIIRKKIWRQNQY